MQEPSFLLEINKIRTFAVRITRLEFSIEVVAFLFQLSNLLLLSILKVFDRIRARDASLLRKVVPVGGDLGLPGLGINACARDQLVSDVSVVFHGAATVNFDEPFKSAVQQNVAGTAAILDLCKDMRKLLVRKRLQRSTHYFFLPYNIPSKTSNMAFTLYYTTCPRLHRLWM